jgi:regulator of replication initiation timing
MSPKDEAELITQHLALASNLTEAAAMLLDAKKELDRLRALEPAVATLAQENNRLRLENVQLRERIILLTSQGVKDEFDA